MSTHPERLELALEVVVVGILLQDMNILSESREVMPLEVVSGIPLIYKARRTRPCGDIHCPGRIIATCTVQSQNSHAPFHSAKIL